MFLVDGKDEEMIPFALMMLIDHSTNKILSNILQEWYNDP